MHEMVSSQGATSSHLGQVTKTLTSQSLIGPHRAFMLPKSSRYQMVYMRAPFAHLDPMQRLFALTADGSESLIFPVATALR